MGNHFFPLAETFLAYNEARIDGTVTGRQQCFFSIKSVCSSLSLVSLSCDSGAKRDNTGPTRIKKPCQESLANEHVAGSFLHLAAGT